MSQLQSWFFLHLTTPTFPLPTQPWTPFICSQTRPAPSTSLSKGRAEAPHLTRQYTPCTEYQHWKLLTNPTLLPDLPSPSSPINGQSEKPSLQTGIFHALLVHGSMDTSFHRINLYMY